MATRGTPHDGGARRNRCDPPRGHIETRRRGVRGHAFRRTAVPRRDTKDWEDSRRSTRVHHGIHPFPSSSPASNARPNRNDTICPTKSDAISSRCISHFVTGCGLFSNPQRESSRNEVSVLATDANGPLWVTIATTGGRRGEALALRWSDVKRDTGTASISRTLAWVKRLRHSRTPRARPPCVPVPLPSHTVAVLREQRKRQAADRHASSPPTDSTPPTTASTPTGYTSHDAKFRHVLRDLSTMSRDIASVSEGGLELL